MQVAVIGIGAIGGLIAAELLAAGHEVTLCARSPLDRLVVERDEHPRAFEITTTTDPATVRTPAPFVVLAVKAQDSAAAAPWLERVATSDSVVVVVQNGVEHDERVTHPRVVPAIANTAVERTAPGHLVHRAGDRVTLADRPGAQAFAELLAPAVLQVVLEADFKTAAWRKLLANVAANPLSTLTLRRAELFGDPSIRELALALLVEVVAIGRAEGARLTDEDPHATLAFFDALPSDAGPSMLYDRLAGRPLEIDPLVGAVLRAADRHGLPAPRTHTLFALLSALT